MKSRNHFDVLVTLATLAALAGPTVAQPSLPVVSEFEFGFDGWNSNEPGQVSWVPAGGNPGGYLRFVDASNTGTGIFSPPSYLGDWSAIENAATIYYDHRVFSGGPQFSRYQMLATGPGGSAIWVGPTPTGPTAWIQIQAPLSARCWTVRSGTWDGLLRDVSELRIEIELGFGPDSAGADSVRFLPVSPCYADCECGAGAGALDIFDFLCFQNEFASAAPYACDCDQSTGPGVCDIFDFLCFQNAFANGCP